jgi:hypothetical protein
VGLQDIAAPALNSFRAKLGVEITIENISTTLDQQPTLQILLCLPFKVGVEVISAHSPRAEAIEPVEDRELGILPAYVTRSPRATLPANRGPQGYFLGETGALVAAAASGLAARAPRLRPGNVGIQADLGSKVIFKAIRFSEWPAKESDIRQFITVCLDFFVAAAQRNRDVSFPR